jgi:protein TonB
MEAQLFMDRLLNRRSAVGLAVIAPHAALVLLLLHSVIARPPTTNPMVVSVIPAPARVREAPAVFHPELLPVGPLLVPPPELKIISDPNAAMIAAAADSASQAAPPLTVSPAGPVALPAMSQIAYLQRPMPRYPAQSRRAREEGLVVLRVVIDPLGRVVSVDVQRSSGHPRLDEAARDAVAGALFKPYMADGVARPASAVIPIEFSLRTASS